MMKKALAFATSAMILTACSNAQPQAEIPTVGGKPMLTVAYRVQASLILI